MLSVSEKPSLHTWKASGPLDLLNLLRAIVYMHVVCTASRVTEPGPATVLIRPNTNLLSCHCSKGSWCGV